MSFSSAAVYAQPRVQRSVDPDEGECGTYSYPNPSVVVTDLDAAIAWHDAAAVDTNLCSEIT